MGLLDIKMLRAAFDASAGSGWPDHAEVRGGRPERAILAQFSGGVGVAIAAEAA
jgi:hypothetical protein